MANIYDKILRDARVKLTEMFDKNFNRQGFFGKKWVPVKQSKTNKAGKKGSILIVSGTMRRSIRSEVRGNAVVFTSHLPYTAIHNEGGKFAGSVRAHTRKVGGKVVRVRAHTRQVNMPQRQFIGDHAEVQKALGDIVYKNIHKESEQLVKKFGK